MTTGRFYASAAAMAAALGGVCFPVTALFAAGRVHIEVTGNIQPYCANSLAAAPIDVGDPRKAGSAKLSFTVDCNAPFQYTLQSDNGALRLADAPAAALSDQIQIPYDVNIRIPLTLGGAIDDTCSSLSIKQGAVSCLFADSGQKVAIKQQAETKLSWTGVAKLPPAGQYTDRLTVMVRVKL